jgi:hypothetical protein
VNGTIDYYQRVQDAVPGTRDFHRIYEAPGIGHCGNVGPGLQPVHELQSLVAWVEHGIVPETLETMNATLYGAAPGPGQSLPTRYICAWPKRQNYKGGDPALAESFYCG